MSTFPNTLTISDDSGFLAIVNAEKYNSFVDEDWELPQLFNRFLEEMNNDNLIVWATGLESDWTVNFVAAPSNESSFREFSKTIKVTNGKLYLTNYEDLTMAAQFSDEGLPTKQNANLCVSLDNGEYELTIRQLYNPNDPQHIATDKVNFEVIVRPITILESKQVLKIFWFQE
jgi:hypothetical protein